MAQKKKIVYRRSDTGRLTTKAYADRHPATTERQHVPVVPRGKAKK